MTGCAQNSPESPVRNDVKCSPYSRSLEEGLKAADVLFSKMSGDATRSVSRQVKSALSVETPRSRTYYYHCVWGWGGKNNGSFIFSSGISVNSYIFGDMGYVANLNKNM